MPWLATRAVNRMSLGQSRPPLAAPKRMVRSGHSRGRACRVTSRNAIGTRCLIRHWLECVEVNANKLLYGNERETSSIRSPRVPASWRLAVPECPGHGGRPGGTRVSVGRCTSQAIWGHNKPCWNAASRPDQGPRSRAMRQKVPAASHNRTRNRTGTANVSVATDDATQGHRTGPSAIGDKEGNTHASQTPPVADLAGRQE